MVLARLNGHSAALSRRLDRLELLAPASESDVDALREQQFRSLPIPLQWYFSEADPEAHRTPLGGSDVFTLYEYALRRVHADQEATTYVSAWILRHAWKKLGGVRMRQAGSNTCQVGSCRYCDQAARELLGSSGAELHDLWTADPDGGRWLSLWWEHGSTDPEVLALAGLGDPEIELLDQEENE